MTNRVLHFEYLVVYQRGLDLYLFCYLEDHKKMFFY
jgi:hypothetical protein